MTQKRYHETFERGALRVGMKFARKTYICKECAWVWRTTGYTNCPDCGALPRNVHLLKPGETIAQVKAQVEANPVKPGCMIIFNK